MSQVLNTRTVGVTGKDFGCSYKQQLHCEVTENLALDSLEQRRTHKADPIWMGEAFSDDDGVHVLLWQQTTSKSSDCWLVSMILDMVPLVLQPTCTIKMDLTA